jgi:hypothetical protein
MLATEDAKKKRLLSLGAQGTQRNTMLQEVLRDLSVLCERARF